MHVGPRRQRALRRHRRVPASIESLYLDLTKNVLKDYSRLKAVLDTCLNGYNLIKGRNHHTGEDNVWFRIAWVNDTRGHITYFACALKSHILQTRLTGHTTYETCASEVTNQYVVRFLVKKLLRAMHLRSFWTNFFYRDFGNTFGNRFSWSPPKILIQFKIIRLHLNLSSILCSISSVYIFHVLSRGLVARYLGAIHLASWARLPS
jgi:hypothetical protein